jgi:DNA-binding GntR family transcriptional regulator
MSTQGKDKMNASQMLEGKQQVRLGDIAYEKLKERLVRGAFEPGYKLTVRAAAEALGVSSTPARDAINRLTIEGALIYTGPKTVVVPRLDARAVEEITLIRLALEGLAAERAAIHGTQEVIAKLEAIQVLIEAALARGHYADVLWHNKEFHFLIYRLSGLPQLLVMIEPLWLRIGASLNNLYPEFAEAKYGVHNHRAAIEALSEQDGHGLRAAIESDIRDGFRRLKKACQGPLQP